MRMALLPASATGRAGRGACSSSCTTAAGLRLRAGWRAGLVIPPILTVQQWCRPTSSSREHDRRPHGHPFCIALCDPRLCGRLAGVRPAAAAPGGLASNSSCVLAAAALPMHPACQPERRFRRAGRHTVDCSLARAPRSARLGEQCTSCMSRAGAWMTSPCRGPQCAEQRLRLPTAHASQDRTHPRTGPEAPHRGGAHAQEALHAGEGHPRVDQAVDVVGQHLQGRPQQVEQRQAREGHLGRHVKAEPDVCGEGGQGDQDGALHRVRLLESRRRSAKPGRQREPAWTPAGTDNCGCGHSAAW